MSDARQPGLDVLRPAPRVMASRGGRPGVRMPGRKIAAPAAILLALTGGPLACAIAPVDFARDVRPLLNAHCTACHGGVKMAGGISFLGRETALAEGDS
ncbi:MAG: hypothetical protein ACKOSQ_06205, partial [Planctomycetaceae bacterium]